MTNEQLIEEALERFKEEFSWNKAPVTTHDDSGNKITPEPLIYEQLEFLKKELSTIASKSAEKNLTQEEKDMLSCLCEDERNRLIFQQPVPKKYYRLLMGIEKKLDRPKEQQ